MKNRWIAKIIIFLIGTGSISLTGNEVAIGVDSTGSAIATWVDFANMDVCIACFNGTTQQWSPSIVVGSSAYSPALAVAPSGNAALVWLNTSAYAGSIIVQGTYYTALTNTWSAVQNLSAVLSSVGASPAALAVSIQSDLNNTAVVVWKENVSSVITVRSCFTTSASAGVWSSSVVLSD